MLYSVYVIINTGQICGKIIRLGGEIGKNFLLAKISSNMVNVCMCRKRDGIFYCITLTARHNQRQLFVHLSVEVDVFNSLVWYIHINQSSHGYRYD